MPVTNGVGHSGATIDKQHTLRVLLGQHLNTCKTIFNKHGQKHWCHSQYQFIDTNAGPGYNDCESCDGSPVIFLKQAQKIEVDYFAHFIEISPEHSKALSGAIDNWNHHQIITGDNRNVLSRVIDDIPPGSYGLLYTDPNGIPDFEMLARASRHPSMKRVDILIRYAASAVKRNQHITGKKMLDYLGKINKQYWIVREPERSDNWQWTFLLGMNWDGLNVMKRHKFHYAHSDRGQEIIEKLNYTNDELKDRRQPPLIPYATYDEYLKHPQYLAIRQQAVERSGGICEQCGKGFVTEVHHVEYPKWGTFEENADYLLAVCHQCHCEIHGKAN
jgi:three-Cys-motif partner protein